MPLKTEPIEDPQLNLTPMVDVVFLLNIFFLLGTRFADTERQYDIQLPTVSVAQPLTAVPDSIVVNVNSNGEIVLNGEQKTLEQLESELVAARENYPDQSVLIRGDGQGLYQPVMDVMSACKRARIRNISLANRLSTEEQP
jgi:biopolymer transport protein ExbD